jgi:hypothetical protein
MNLSDILYLFFLSILYLYNFPLSVITSRVINICFVHTLDYAPYGAPPTFPPTYGAPPTCGTPAPSRAPLKTVVLPSSQNDADSN